jgi:uncharacterized membrane protein
MDEDRIDFQALDPWRDPTRFERTVQAVVAGALPPAASTHTLLAALLGWGRVAIACASLLAIGSWVPALMRPREDGRTSPAPSDTVALVASWAEAGAIPDDADVFRALRDQMAADASPRRIHVWSGLLVLGVFLAGAMTGAGVVVWLRPSGFPPGPPPRAAGLPPPLAELGLTPEQEAKARTIAEKYRPALEAVLQQTFPRIREVQERMDRELRSVLTEAQAKRFDELKLRRPPAWRLAPRRATGIPSAARPTAARRATRRRAGPRRIASLTSVGGDRSYSCARAIARGEREEER